MPMFPKFLGYPTQSPTTSFSSLPRKDLRPSSGFSTPGSPSVYSQLWVGVCHYANNVFSSADKVGCLTSVRMTAGAKLSRYFRRLVHIRQMDFEFAAWQMLYLLIHPQKVYRKFMYRKSKKQIIFKKFKMSGTKDQWARDDPAFLVLLAASLALSSILFAVVLKLSFGGFIAFFLWAVFIDCIGVGLIIATILW